VLPAEDDIWAQNRGGYSVCLADRPVAVGVVPTQAQFAVDALRRRWRPSLRLMRLSVSNPALIPDLLEFLRSRVDVVAEEVSDNEVDVSLVGSYNADAMNIELATSSVEVRVGSRPDDRFRLGLPCRIGAVLGPARVQLCVDALAQELHDQVEFGLAQNRLDRTDDPELCADPYSLADFKRPPARQATGRDHFIAAAQLIATGEAGHQRPATIRLNSDFDAKRRRCGRVGG